MVRLKSVELVSPLSEETCLQILRNSIDGEFSPFGNHGIQGRIGEHDFRLRKRRSFFGRNSFQTYLLAETAGVGQSTLVRCRLGLHPLMLAIIVGWVLVFLVTSLDRAARAFDAADPVAAAWTEISGMLMMLGFGAVFLVVSRIFARCDLDYLLAFLRATIDADEPR